jgi:hypothetical protein
MFITPIFVILWPSFISYSILIPTEHQFHDAILKEFRDVVQHSVLKKWLYLPEATEDFETLASDIVEAVKMNDQRFGVEPQEKVSRKKK